MKAQYEKLLALLDDALGDECNDKKHDVVIAEALRLGVVSKMELSGVRLLGSGFRMMNLKSPLLRPGVYRYIKKRVEEKIRNR